MGVRDIDDKRRGQTLDPLECTEWGPPDFDSGLVRRCHELRRKPIGDFSEADLRIIIGQGIGLQFLVPLALEKLEVNPLVKADYYEGN